MKKAMQYWKQQRGMLLPLLLLTALLLLGMLSTLYLLAPFWIYDETGPFFKKANLNNSLYFMPATDIMIDDSMDEEKIKSFSAVKDLVRVVDDVVISDKITGFYLPPELRDASGKTITEFSSVQYCSDAFIDAFPNLAEEGKWIGSSDTIQEGEPIEAVVSGFFFVNVSVGDMLTLKSISTGTEYKVKVIGKNNEPSFVPDFTNASNQITTADLVNRELGHGNIYLHEQYRGDLKSDYPVFGSYGAFVRLQENATEVQYKELTDYLSDKGVYATYEQIIENDILAQKQETVRPYCVMGLALLFILLVYLVMAMFLRVRREKEFPPYFLCGATGKSFHLGFAVLLAVPIVIMVLCVLMLFGIQNMLYFYRIDLLIWTEGVYLFGNKALVLVVGYTALLLALHLLISYFSYRRSQKTNREGGIFHD